MCNDTIEILAENVDWKGAISLFRYSLFFGILFFCLFLCSALILSIFSLPLFVCYVMFVCYTFLINDTHLPCTTHSISNAINLNAIQHSQILLTVHRYNGIPLTVWLLLWCVEKTGEYNKFGRHCKVYSQQCIELHSSARPLRSSWVVINAIIRISNTIDDEFISTETLEGSANVIPKKVFAKDIKKKKSEYKQFVCEQIPCERKRILVHSIRKRISRKKNIVSFRKR